MDCKADLSDNPAQCVSWAVPTPLIARSLSSWAAPTPRNGVLMGWGCVAPNPIVCIPIRTIARTKCNAAIPDRLRWVVPLALAAPARSLQ